MHVILGLFMMAWVLLALVLPGGCMAQRTPECSIKCADRKGLMITTTGDSTEKRCHCKSANGWDELKQ